MQDDYTDAADGAGDNCKYILGVIATTYSSDAVYWEELTTDVAPTDYALGADEVDKFQDRFPEYYFQDAIASTVADERMLHHPILLRHYQYLYNNFISIEAGESVAGYFKVFNAKSFFLLAKDQTVGYYNDYLADSSSALYMEMHTYWLAELMPLYEDLIDEFIANNPETTPADKHIFTENMMIWDLDGSDAPEYEQEDADNIKDFAEEITDLLNDIYDYVEDEETDPFDWDDSNGPQETQREIY